MKASTLFGVTLFLTTATLSAQPATVCDLNLTGVEWTLPGESTPDKVRTLSQEDGVQVELMSYKKDGVLAPTNRIKRTLDNDGRLQQVTTEFFQDGQWQVATREDIEYIDAKNKQIWSSLSFENGTWSLLSRSVLQMDESGQEKISLKTFVQTDGVEVEGSSMEYRREGDILIRGRYRDVFKDGRIVETGTVHSRSKYQKQRDRESTEALVKENREWVSQKDGKQTRMTDEDVAKFVDRLLNANADKRTRFEYDGFGNQNRLVRESHVDDAWRATEIIETEFSACNLPVKEVKTRYSFDGESTPVNTAVYHYEEVHSPADELGAIAGPIEALYPNPASSTATLVINVSESDPVEVNLFDAAGRKIRTLNPGQLGAGRHEVAIDAGSLPPGIYAVQMISGSTKNVRMLTVR